MRDPAGRGPSPPPTKPAGPVVRDDPARAAPTVRIAARDRWPVALSTLIGGFLAIAILKPWVGDVLAPPPAVAASVAPAPPPSVGPDPLAAVREHCQDPIGWRVYSRELWLARPIRTWRSVQPAAAATGPADPAIPVVPLGPTVEALGYCSPWSTTERPPDATRVTAWRRSVSPSGDVRFAVVGLRSIAPAEPSVLAALFAGIEPTTASATPPAASATPGADAGAPGSPDVPAASADGSLSWPAGRYVFALRAAGWERWWSVDVAEPDGARPGSTTGPPGSTPADGPTSP